MSNFLEWGRGGLRRGLFFIAELHLIIFGESDFNYDRGVDDGLVLHRRTTPGPLWRV